MTGCCGNSTKSPAGSIDPSHALSKSLTGHSQRLKVRLTTEGRTLPYIFRIHEQQSSRGRHHPAVSRQAIGEQGWYDDAGFDIQSFTGTELPSR